LILTNLALTTPIAGQQKHRTQDKPPAKVAAAPMPAPPTFDTLLAADCFKIYAEVRGVGQLIKSSAANDVLEPILKLGGPPKDFVAGVEWLKSNADQLTTARMLVAAWPNAKDVPEILIAIEFSSAEEATKFEKPLNGVLPTMFPPVTPRASPEADKKSAPQPPSSDQKPPAPVPGYSLQREGSLLIVSPAPVQLKKLRPAGSKPLSEDPNFRVAYNRFAAEPLFVFIDFNGIQREHEEQFKRYQDEERKAAEARKELQEKQPAAEPEVLPDRETRVEIQVNGDEKVGVLAQPPAEVQTEPQKEPTQAEIASMALSSISYSLFAVPPVTPDAIGIGFSPENDSFDLRVLLIDAAGKTSDPVPFLPSLKFGSPIAPQSPSVIPADSELVLTMSLDFQQIYTRMSAPSIPSATVRGLPGEGIAPDSGGPLTTLEQLLKIKVKDDLLPLLGSEVAVSLPLKDYNPFGPPNSGPTPQAKDEASSSTVTPLTPFVVVSLRDKEAMRRLLPKIVEGFAGKSATSLAQTERRQDTELVSYANMFAYAFVGDFLVLSSDAATTRHVVDSYLKGSTLAADVQFRNYTRWQAHELQGQVYVSPAFMESYKTWANSPTARISDEARAFVTRVTATAQPITYSLSNDGLGTLHELHVPKSIVLLATTNAASSENPPETVKNERAAMTTLWSISNAEREFKEKNKSGFASFDELIAAELFTKERLDTAHYKFEMTVIADGFTVSAVPVEYGKSGKLSFYLDQTGLIRGADHGGGPASASDPAVTY
jgi:hypothetical protein